MTSTIAIIGAGPAGLIAAERLAQAGHRVTVYDRMASPARKFLLAGRGGLNLTHSEPLDRFAKRYREAADWLAPALDAFPPQALRDWADGLGADTFIGSSGRVFPRALKASPLLRAWLARLDTLGVSLRPRLRWLGFDDGGLVFEGPQGREQVQAQATLLALGGASWPRLGSDGSWVDILTGRGVGVVPLRPANGGFRVAWSDYFIERFAGTPLKRIALSFAGETVSGEAMIDRAGIEGGAIYALSSRLREAVLRDGAAELAVDLRPDLDVGALTAKLAGRRKGETLSNLLRKAGLSPVAIALLREGGALPDRPEPLAARVKALPLRLAGLFPLERAISTAGGIPRDEIDGGFMLKRLPGVFVAGEMLDWEAPTGGYLLQGCFATGVAAAEGIGRWLER